MEFLYKPWPWYVSGSLIGLMVPMLLIFCNKQFGISSSFRHFCAMCIPGKNPFFNYDWKKEIWMIILALGMVVGGFFSNHYLVTSDNLKFSSEANRMFEDWNLYYGQSREIHEVHENGDEGGYKSNEERVLMPSEIFSFSSFSSPIGWIFLVLGGFLVGFGTRWANGCTSGHAIMGLSLLNPGSLVAVIGFFIGGLTVSWFVIPYFL